MRERKGVNAYKRLREENSVKDILGLIIKDSNLEVGINAYKVRLAWRDVLGPGISSYTQEVALKRGTLFVKLTSTIVIEELTYGKSKIISLLNEEIGAEVVKDIVFR